MNVTETRRLVLRHFRPRDAGAMLAVFGDPEVMRYSDHGVQPLAWVRGWLRACREDYRRWGYGHYAVVEREGGTVVGYCGLAFHPDFSGRPEVGLGYRLARAAWGKGYATEAALAVVAHAFDGLGLRRLIALVDPGNAASARVAEKLGMRHAQDVMLPGYTHPDRVYVIERGE